MVLKEWEEFIYTCADRIWTQIRSLVGNSHFDTMHPIWFLGTCLQSELTDSQTEEGLKKKFLERWMLCKWFSYKRNFPPLYDSEEKGEKKEDDSRRFITSDIGWGCMIRCGQMILYTALRRHYFSVNDQLSADILISSSRTDDVERSSSGRVRNGQDHVAARRVSLGDHVDTREMAAKKDLEILDAFRDDGARLFSLHNIVKVGKRAFNLPVGSMYGSVHISKCIQHILQDHEDIRALIFTNGCIYADQIEDVITNQEKSVLLLVPLHLGLQKLESRYVESIKDIMRIPYFAGILGGKTPQSAVYYVGYQEDSLFYLDPHTVQTSGGKGEMFVSPHISTMNISTIQPQMTMGFFLKDKKDMDKFRFMIEEFSSAEEEINASHLVKIYDETPKPQNISPERLNDILCFSSDEDE